jgi:hypothetical protein
MKMDINGKVLTKTWSGLSHRTWISVVLESLLLMIIGAVAVTLHARMRTPLNIPGHHGLEFMAIFILARMGSNLKFAASISSLGIGMLLLFPILGFKDPFIGFNYMLPGFLLDALYISSPRLKRNLIFLSIISGLAYFMIPLSRLVLMATTGFPYNSFIKHGFFLTLLSFLLFGMAGGFLGAGLVSSIRKLRKK